MIDSYAQAGIQQSLVTHAKISTRTSNISIGSYCHQHLNCPFLETIFTHLICPEDRVKLIPAVDLIHA
jgi:hypothetical protein